MHENNQKLRLVSETPDEPTASPTRDKLRAAIAAVEAAEIELAKSIEAHRRSIAMLETAEADVAAFADLDGAISTHKAAKLKEAIATGAAAPDLSELPADLAARRTKRAAAAEKLEAVRGVHAELAADAKAAEKKVERMKYELDLAVEAVAAEDAKALAEAFVADVAELRRRYWPLLAVCGRRIRTPDATQAPGEMPFRQFKLDPIVHSAANTHSIVGDYELTHGPVERESAAKAVAEFISALRKNPDATL